MTTDLALTRDELKTLAERLEQIEDIELRAAIALTGTASQPLDLAGTHTQPRSRPPYPLHLEAMLETLYNELGTTARDMCEHRGLDYTGGRSCAAVAKWISDYRQSLASMPQGVELYGGLIAAIDKAARAVNQADEERKISQEMIDAANRSVVTVATIEGFARKLGEQGKGLTQVRMRNLVRHTGLSEASTDPDTGAKFYRLGDVLFFHREYGRRTRKRAG